MINMYLLIQRKIERHITGKNQYTKYFIGAQMSRFLVGGGSVV